MKQRTSWQRWASAGGCLLLSASIGYGVRVYAEGAPTLKPLFYAGTLESGGKPAAGAHTIVLTLFDAETAGKQLCTSETPNAPVEAGRFRVEVSGDCVAAMRGQPDVWVALKFTGPDGVPHELPLRSKVGGVPYAMEAQHAVSASSASGGLAGQVVPPGMIAMFAGACPAGWAEYTALAGRVPRGERAGQPLDQGGSDDAVVVAHTHPLQVSVAAGGDHAHGCSASTSAAGNHTHMQNIVAPVEATGCNSGVYRRDWVDDHAGCPIPHVSTDEAGSHAHAAACSVASGGAHAHTASGTATSTGVAAAGANLPRFQEVVFCVKQ